MGRLVGSVRGPAQSPPRSLRKETAILDAGADKIVPVQQCGLVTGDVIAERRFDGTVIAIFLGRSRHENGVARTRRPHCNAADMAVKAPLPPNHFIIGQELTSVGRITAASR